MRKFTLLLAMVALTAFSARSFGQAKDNAVKTNLMGMIISQYQLSYERAVSEKFSVQLSGAYITREWGILDTDGETDIDQTGWMVIPEARYYFGEALKGGYVAGFARLRGVDWVYRDLNTTDGFDNSGRFGRSVAGGGLLFGYQALASDVLVFDIFLGPQFKSVTVKDWKFDADNNDPSYNDYEGNEKIESSGTGLRFGFNLGIAF